MQQIIDTNPALGAVQQAYTEAGAPFDSVFAGVISKHITDDVLKAVVLELSEGLAVWEAQHQPKTCVGRILQGLVQGIFGSRK